MPGTITVFPLGRLGSDERQLLPQERVRARRRHEEPPERRPEQHDRGGDDCGERSAHSHAAVAVSVALRGDARMFPRREATAACEAVLAIRRL